MASIKACIKCAATPFVKLANKVEQTAISKNAAAPGAFQAEAATYNAKGTDIAVDAAKKIWANRGNLFWWRVERAFLEGRAVANGAYFQGYGYKNAVVDLRFFTRLMAVFILGTFAGRGQVFPFVTPSSGYALEMKQ